MSWFSKLFGREAKPPIETQTRETPDGGRETSVSFTLDGDNVRVVRDDVVQALDDALAAHDEDLLHLVDPTRMMRWDAGGPPTWSIATLRVEAETPYWLWVTYGFSGVLTPVDYRQAYRHEYAIAVPCADGPRPMWPAALLRQMTQYVLESGAELRVGDNIPCNMPISHVGTPPEARDGLPPSELVGMLVGLDPLVPSVETAQGEIEIRRFVGLEPQEIGLLQRWNGKSLWEEMRGVLPTMACVLDRPSLLEDPEFSARAEARAAEEGSALGVLYVDGGWQPDGDAVVLTLPGGADARTISAVLKARLPHGRPLVLQGPPDFGPVIFEPADTFAMILEEGEFILQGSLEDGAFQAITTALESDAPSVTIRFGG